MKRDNFLLLPAILILFIFANNTMAVAKSSFKFPEKIEYDLYKNENLVGTCTYSYNSNTGQAGVIFLGLTNFEAVGFSDRDELITSVSNKDFSLYFDTVTRGSKKIREIEVKEEKEGFKGKKKQFLYYWEQGISTKEKTEISSKYPVINFLSSFLVASKMAVSGESGTTKPITLVNGKVIKNVEMKYLHMEKLQFHGVGISAHVLSIVDKKYKIYQFKIHKDTQGYYFPVRIAFSDEQKNTFEMRMKEKTFQEPQSPQQQQLYAANLLFMEATSRSIRSKSEEGRLINEAFMTELNRELKELAANKGQQVSINEKGHKIQDKGEIIRGLIDLTIGAKASLPYNERVKKIIDGLMIPNHVDVIVAGQYIDEAKSPSFIIRPILIFKSPPKIITKNFLFKKDEMICHDSPDKINLCGNAPQIIAREIKKLLPEWPGKEPVKPPPKPQKVQTKPPIPQKVQTKPPILPKQISFQPSEPPMAVEDIYQMVIKNEYFCHSGENDYHRRVLERLRQTKKINLLSNVVTVTKSDSQGKPFHEYTFKQGWESHSEIIGKNILITLSKKINSRMPGKRLYWAPAAIKNCNFNDALEKIEKLNQENYGKFSDWRIPTLKEIFLVSGKYTGNSFFPFDWEKKFSSPIKIWTSTPVNENEKTQVKGCNEEAYFIIDNIHVGNYHRFHFDISCKNKIAYVLPVRSDQENIPGSTAGGQSQVTSHPPTTAKISQPTRKIYIARLPFCNKNTAAVVDTRDIRLIKQVVLEKIEEWAGKSAAFDYSIPNEKKSVKKLIEFTFDPYLPNDKRVDKMVARVTIPNEVEIIITGEYKDDRKSNFVSVRPIIIVKARKKVLTENIELQRSELNCSDPGTGQKELCYVAKNKIKQVVQKLLERLK